MVPSKNDLGVWSFGLHISQPLVLHVGEGVRVADAVHVHVYEKSCLKNYNNCARTLGTLSLKVRKKYVWPL
jgi:hypothetical protein